MEEPKRSICARTVDTQREVAPKTCKWKKKKRICWGHGLFSPEAVIYLGQSPTLNHCVCFYGLSGFVCAPQPLKVVGGTADFSPNLGIVKPHHFLALEKCLASHWAAEDLYTSAQMEHADEFRMCVCFIPPWRTYGGKEHDKKVVAAVA